MLESGAVKLTTQRRASQLAGLVAAFAALRLLPRRLLAAACEALKQQAPLAVAYLGPWESVVLTWALSRLDGGGGGASSGSGGGGSSAVPGGPQSVRDPTAWALLLDRATRQVGGARARAGSSRGLRAHCAAYLAVCRPSPASGTSRLLPHRLTPAIYSARSASCRATTLRAPTACWRPPAWRTRRCWARCAARCGSA